MTKRVSCPRCGKRFPTEGRMNDHLRDKHGGNTHEPVQAVPEPASSLSSKAYLLFIGFCIGVATLGMLNNFFSAEDGYRAGAAVRAWAGGLF